MNGSTGGWISQTKFRYPYSVDADGKPDLSTFQLKAELAPFVMALNARKSRDGKSIWKSKAMKPGMLQEFSVDLSRVKSLELLADPTADGSGSDWGLWLSPGLHR